MVSNVDRAVYKLRPPVKTLISRCISHSVTTRTIKKISAIGGYYLPTFLINHIDIEPIATCDLKCGFCNVPGWDRARQTKPMTLEAFKSVIDKFRYLTHVKLQGNGEPLLNRFLPDMVKYASERSIKTTINSHGGLLTPALSREFLNAGLTTMNCSFDGASKETYEKARVNSDFDKVTNNIRTLCDLKSRMRSDLRVGLTCLVSNRRILEEVPRLVELSSDLGVDKLHVKGRLKHWEKAADNSYSFTITTNDSYDFYQDIKAQSTNLANQLGVKFTMGDSDNLFSDNAPCWWPWRSLYISTEGYVIPCCVNATPETWNMGSIFDKPLSGIWNSKEYRMLRKNLLSAEKPKTCVSCYKAS